MNNLFKFTLKLEFSLTKLPMKIPSKKIISTFHKPVDSPRHILCYFLIQYSAHISWFRNLKNFRENFPKIFFFVNWSCSSTLNALEKKKKKLLCGAEQSRLHRNGIVPQYIYLLTLSSCFWNLIANLHHSTSSARYKRK